ncbi:LysR family transcriptional regulator [Janthinobacterium agaricidamnosum]|uniref:Bacterial regulatory helix-turn-helix, lysR family protein n=1 Tax=Janthinobacterium agaricidamnosum NBRC 102515 = DSM 9628 TaxID=1349767 RepID=W0V9C5_9BURK|nr:LysR substrate-binding domain-containing protein [Janthinobacterium agaricidamnosum]CDG83892.1 bacterial regulatory helix-turn-helix, lysR family protein [Janthinobacterium agaricidamnosum NBRC 102515 = DSM 9628]
MLELRQLHYFVAVAEEEHVGRAAERLHISQSPLSRQIAQLEERLGLTLFERSQQRIRLTSDGHIFLAETRAFLTHASRLEAMAKRLGKGDEGGLCIGHIENAMYSGLLPNGLRALRVSRPTVHIALYNMDSAEQLEGLRQRSLDIALVCEPPAPDDPDLECALVLSDQMLLALPENHPLATCAQLTEADLRDQEWIAMGHKETKLRHNVFVSACAEQFSTLGLVAAGLGIAMIQSSLRRHAPAGVVLRELPWFTYRTQMWAAWHKVNLRPLVGIFRATLLASAAESGIERK